VEFVKSVNNEILKVANNVIRWYKSKVDWWIVPLLAIPPVVASVVAATSVINGEPAELAWGFGALLFVTGIYVGLVFPMRYGIGEDRLIVRFGLCHQHILFKDIMEVHPTRNPLSSPALSLSRLHIQFGKGIFNAVMISPTQREEFLSELAHAAELKRDGERLMKSLPDISDDVQ
jgi:hypothetical protein